MNENYTLWDSVAHVVKNSSSYQYWSLTTLVTSTATWSPDVDYTVLNGSPVEFPNYIKYAATLVCGVVLVLGIVGNILVPVIVSKTKELRNSTHLFLINLSVADLLVLIVCLPTVLIELHSQPETWVLGEGMCKAVPFLDLTVAHASIMTILAISFERYYAICKPLKAGYTCTKVREGLVIAGIWSVALIVTTPVLVITHYTMTTYIDGTLVPACWNLTTTITQKAYFFGINALFFWIPFAVLLIMYGVIAKNLMLDTQLLHSSIDKNRVRSRRQVVSMLAAVVAVFFVCLMPFRVFTLWLVVVPEDDVIALGMETYYNLLYFCRIMFYINSAINPILYGAISTKFRDGFKKLLCLSKTSPVQNYRSHVPCTGSTSLTICSSLKSSKHHYHIENGFSSHHASINGCFKPTPLVQNSKEFKIPKRESFV